MAETFFNRIADDVLQAAEQIQNRFEEGWSFMSKGELPNQPQQPTQPQQPIIDMSELSDMGELEGLTEDEIRELLQTEQDLMMQHSPLKGIADGVVGDIMAGNVCCSFM
jgi:hypothetical protein